MNGIRNMRELDRVMVTSERSQGPEIAVQIEQTNLSIEGSGIETLFLLRYARKIHPSDIITRACSIDIGLDISLKAPLAWDVGRCCASRTRGQMVRLRYYARSPEADRSAPMKTHEAQGKRDETPL